MIENNNKHLFHNILLLLLLPSPVSPEFCGVLTSPGMASARLCVVVSVTTVDTTRLLARSSETTRFAVLIVEKKNHTLAKSSWL